jgi:large subunit ribosomal protein L13
MLTYTATPKDIEQDHWFIVDAEGVPLGRLASRVAQVIRGKHKPMFTPHMDTGDGVIVVNAAKVRLTGRKMEQKGYFTHSGYMGHDKITPIKSVMGAHPERVIEKAVFGMLPKSSLSRQVLRGKLRVYAGAEHPHAAQQPAPLAVFPPRQPKHKKGK